MTEKIIIDGVDIAECEHYCEKINTGSGVIQNPLKQGFCLHNITGLQNADIYFRMLTFPKCREQSNCYYKQLKRLEQDSKQLTQWLDEARRNADFWCDKCTSLEQENKELKKLRCKFKEYCTCNTENYRSALEEIKTVINQSCDKCKYNKDGITCCIGDCGEGKLKIIENKINEVLQ